MFFFFFFHSSHKKFVLSIYAQFVSHLHRKGTSIINDHNCLYNYKPIACLKRNKHDFCFNQMLVTMLQMDRCFAVLRPFEQFFSHIRMMDG